MKRTFKILLIAAFFSGAISANAQRTTATANLPAHRPQNGYSLASRTLKVEAGVDYGGEVDFFISIPDQSAEGYSLNGTLYETHTDYSLQHTDIPVYISGTIVVNGEVRIPLTEQRILLGSEIKMVRSLGKEVLVDKDCAKADDCEIKSLSLDNFSIVRSDRRPVMEKRLPGQSEEEEGEDSGEDKKTEEDEGGSKSDSDEENANYDVLYKAQIEAGLLVKKAQQLERMGDTKAALALYQKANAIYPSHEKQEKINNLQINLGIRSVTKSIAGSIVARWEREEEERYQEILAKNRQLDAMKKEYYRKWIAAQSDIADYARAKTPILTGDVSIREKTTKGFYPPLPPTVKKHRNHLFSLKKLIENQKKLANENSSETAYVFLYSPKMKGYTGSAGFAMLQYKLARKLGMYRTRPTAAELKQVMPLPSMEIFYTNIKSFPIDKIMGLTSDIPDEVFLDMLDLPSPLEASSTLIVATTNKNNAVQLQEAMIQESGAHIKTIPLTLTGNADAMFKTLDRKTLNNKFFKAVVEGDTVKMKALLNKGANINSSYPFYGQGKARITPLIWTIQNNKHTIFNYLLENNASPNWTALNNLKGPLEYAIKSGRFLMVRRLLKEGAIKESSCLIDYKKNIWGDILDFAIYYQRVSAVEELILDGMLINADEQVINRYVQKARLLEDSLKKQIIINLLTNNTSEEAEKYYDKAIALYNQGKYTAAIRMFDKAIKINPDYYIYVNRGSAKRMNKDYPGALNDFNAALDFKKDDYFAYYQTGQIYVDLKQWDKAFNAFAQALKRDPDNPSVLNSYAWNLAINNRQLNKAEQMILRALNTYPSNNYYLDTAGWVYFKKGNYEKAKDYLQDAVNTGNATEVEYEHLGDAMAKLNQLFAAKKRWQTACNMGSQTACDKIEAAKKLPQEDKEESFPIAQTMPELIGGLQELYRHIVYPREAIQQGIEGKVLLTFMVEADGTVSNIKIAKDIGGGCGEAAVTALKKVRFRPGTQAGKTIRVRFSVPVTFALTD